MAHGFYSRALRVGFARVRIGFDSRKRLLLDLHACALIRHLYRFALVHPHAPIHVALHECTLRVSSRSRSEVGHLQSTLIHKLLDGFESTPPEIMRQDLL